MCVSRLQLRPRSLPPGCCSQSRRGSLAAQRTSRMQPSVHALLPKRPARASWRLRWHFQPTWGGAHCASRQRPCTHRPRLQSIRRRPRSASDCRESSASRGALAHAPSPVVPLTHLSRKGLRGLFPVAAFAGGLASETELPYGALHCVWRLQSPFLTQSATLAALPGRLRTAGGCPTRPLRGATTDAPVNASAKP